MKLSDRMSDVYGRKSTMPRTLWNYTVLDCSGSMAGGKFTEAVGGIEKDIQSMREDTTGVRFMVGVVEFEGNYSSGKFYTYAVKPMDISTVVYRPGKAVGGTPLYATLGAVIDDILKIKPLEDACIITVFTDGEDNTSHGSPYGTPRALKAKIDSALESNISVKFIGTAFDVQNMIRNVGIKTGDTFIHDNSERGIQRSMKAKVDARVSYTKGYAGGMSANSLNSMDFFEQPKEETKKDKKDKI